MKSFLIALIAVASIALSFCFVDAKNKDDVLSGIIESVILSDEYSSSFVSTSSKKKSLRNSIQQKVAGKAILMNKIKSSILKWNDDEELDEIPEFFDCLETQPTVTDGSCDSIQSIIDSFSDCLPTLGKYQAEFVSDVCDDTDEISKLCPTVTIPFCRDT